MVAFYPHFVSCGEKATLNDVVGELNEFNSIISLEASPNHPSSFELFKRKTFEKCSARSSREVKICK